MRHAKKQESMALHWGKRQVIETAYVEQDAGFKRKKFQSGHHKCILRTKGGKTKGRCEPILPQIEIKKVEIICFVFKKKKKQA